MSAKRRARSRKPIWRNERGVQRHRTGDDSPTAPGDKGSTPAGKRTGPRDKQGEPHGPVTGRRLWLFRFGAAIVVPVLLFLLAEMSLRVIGYGFPAAAIIKCKVDGKDAWCDNPRFGWRFFPRRMARELVPFMFPAAKSEDTCRIFVLGESAVKGEPDSAYCFARILRAILREQYPGTRFEVIPVAMPAINSNVVAEIAADCAKHQPDLIIVYLGNNEVTGPYGAGTVFAPPVRHMSLIRAGIALKATRLGQMMTHLVERAAAERDGPAAWHGLEMFLGKQIPATDRRLQSVYEHLEGNLKRIIDVTVSSASKIIVCTVGSNLRDCPPFASLHRPQLGEQETEKWDTFYKQGITRETAGDYEEAVKDYLAACEIDGSYAELQFRLARCYWAAAHYDQARERYIQARELDTLRFRADTRINEIIRAAAGEKTDHGVYLVDAVKMFEENSPHQVPGDELFYEHVHMTFKGNYLVARALAEQVGDILPQRIKQQGANRHLLTEAECARCLACTEWAQYNNAYKILNYYIKKPPFTNQLDHEQQVRQMETRLKALQNSLTPQVLKDTGALFRQLIEDDPCDVWLRWRYAELLSAHLHNESAAAEQCRIAQGLLPSSYRSHLLLALSLERLGRWGEAVQHLRRAIQIKPASAEAYYHLGLACQSEGRSDEAIKHLSRAIHLQPTNPQAYMRSAVLLSGRNRVDEAIGVLRKGTRYIPDDPVLHFNLGVLLDRRNRRDEAIQELRTAMRIDPNSAEIRGVLESILRRTDY